MRYINSPLSFLSPFPLMIFYPCSLSDSWSSLYCRSLSPDMSEDFVLGCHYLFFPLNHWVLRKCLPSYGQDRPASSGIVRQWKSSWKGYKDALQNRDSEKTLQNWRKKLSYRVGANSLRARLVLIARDRLYQAIICPDSMIIYFNRFRITSLLQNYSLAKL